MKKKTINESTWFELLKIIDKQTSAAQRVREIHVSGGTYCFQCGSNEYPVEYPCPTIKALDGE